MDEHAVDLEQCCGEWIVACSCGFRMAGVPTKEVAVNVREMHCLSPHVPAPACHRMHRHVPGNVDTAVVRAWAEGQLAALHAGDEDRIERGWVALDRLLDEKPSLRIVEEIE